MIDIGGRRFRTVRDGPAGAGPLIVFEADAFGAACDFAPVQAALHDRRRTFAYDRAGLGDSDPGPRPRDSRAIAADLQKLLSAAGEAPPFVLMAQGMGSLHAYAYVLRYPEAVDGLILIDPVPPTAPQSAAGRAVLSAAKALVGAAPLAAALRLTSAASVLSGEGAWLGAEVRAEKRRFQGAADHAAWAASEVRLWEADADYVAGLGELDRELPVAVVTAGSGPLAWKRAQAEPARRSRSGYAVNVAAARKETLFAPKHRDEVVKAIDFVVRAAASRRR